MIARVEEKIFKELHNDRSVPSAQCFCSVNPLKSVRKLSAASPKFNFSIKPTFEYSSLVEDKVQSFAMKSMMGKSPDNPNKVNQDTGFAIRSFYRFKNGYIFGVLDGHGKEGHVVSNYVKKSFLRNIEQAILKSQKVTPASKKRTVFTVTRKAESTTNLKNYSSQILNPNIIFDAFRMTNNDLQLSNINIEHSGTTFVMALIIGRQFICANVGDSRMVVGRFNKGWMAKAISKDHKPDAEGECERIVMANGVVKEWEDLDGQLRGPKRVWKRGEYYPGLAMSRSLGDKVAEEIGVIWTPDIIQETLNNDDKIIVIASDGIWEHLTNAEVIQIVGKYWFERDSTLAVEELIKEARSRWIAENKEAIDDITAIVIFLR